LYHCLLDIGIIIMKHDLALYDTIITERRV